MLAIVALHSNHFFLGFAGVHVFLALSLGFLREDRSWTEVVASRSRRLLFPWVAWCGIYGIFMLALIFMGQQHEKIVPLMLLYGTKIHLWYLPYLFFASLLAYGMLQVRTRFFRSSQLSIIAAIIGTCIIIVVVSARSYLEPPLIPPFAQWVDALPGIGIGIVYLYMRREDRFDLWVLFMAGSLLFVSLLASALYGFNVTASVLCAICVLTAVWYFGSYQSPAWLEYCGSLAYGIYLTHPLFLFMARKIFPPIVYDDGFMPVGFAVMGSAVLTAVIMQ